MKRKESVKRPVPGEARLLLYFTRKETEILMAEVLQINLTLLRCPDPRKNTVPRFVTILSRREGLGF
jgi:hypothetical protein